MVLQDKVLTLYNRIKETFYLCRDDLPISGQSYNSTLLFGVLTEVNKGNQLLFGEYGGGKTTSSEYLHCLFNGLPLDLVRRVVVRADPQKTDEKLIGRPDYGKLFGQQEKVVWQHFVLVGPKIVDEFNRLPESNQSILLNGVDRGEWNYLNDFVTEGPQPLFATCNYADRGNNTLIPPLLDRFDVSVEAKYCGVANEDAISDDFHNDKDEMLKNPDLTKKALQILNSGKSYEEVQEELRDITRIYSKLILEQAGFSVLNTEEKKQAEEEIKNIQLDRDAHLYFLFLAAELNVSAKFGDKRSTDPEDKSNGLYLNSMFTGSGSRRATKAIKRYAKSVAWLQGNKEVNLDHILQVAPYVLWHRIPWTHETRQRFRDDERHNPLDLYITKTLLGEGSSEVPGVKKRFLESKENYQRLLDLVAVGEIQKASEFAENCAADGKGHPLFIDTLRDL